MKMNTKLETAGTRPAARRSASPALWPGLLSCLLLAACATQHPEADAHKPGAGVARYRELVVFSTDAIRQALQSLDQLTAKPGRESFDTFAETVRRLESDSIRVRARSQAMEARGEAYFTEWTERLAQVEDPAARQLAEQRRDALKQDFDHLLDSVRQARQAFSTFLPALRHLRNTLEQNPGLESVNSARALVAEAEISGHQVQEKLADIMAQLNLISARLEAEPAAHAPPPSQSLRQPQAGPALAAAQPQ